MTTNVNIKDKLGLDTYKVAKESHLQVNGELCKNCEGKCCLYICPARVYTLDEKGDVHIEFEACLECGTCLIACVHDAILWNYPKGGFGVHYKYG
jgi:ferredoxin like protein